LAIATEERYLKDYFLLIKNHFKANALFSDIFLGIVLLTLSIHIYRKRTFFKDFFL